MFIKASVGKGFGVARQSLAVVGVLSLFGFVWNLINIYFAPKLQTPSARVSLAMVFASVVFILASIFLQAGTLGYIREKIKQGKADFSLFMSSGSRYYGRLFLVGLIITLAVVAFIAVGAVAVAFLKTVGIVIAVLIGIAAVYLILLMFFAPYAVVINEEKAMASIKKSMGLVKKNFLGVLGISGLLILIGFLAGLLVGLIFGLMNVALPGIVSQVIFAFLSSILNAYLGIFVSASFMNFYLEINNTPGV
jgi:hypothetical protein